MTQSQVDKLVKPGTLRDRAYGTSGSVQYSHITHQYGGITAIDDISLTVPSGEFVTLLGASGSGKSTLLHATAGLLPPSSGDIYISGRNVSGFTPQQREIGLVFQNYALFPHMSAAQNVGFPLSVRHERKQVISARVEEMLSLIRLSAYGERLPSELSGGQQQRVAIGRALAAKPPVLLLDEPLGALDRNLRLELGRELKRIQQETGVTAIYVTHDQEEALSLSDQIAVLRSGHLEQMGTPVNIYNEPTTAFVAQFVGEINLLDVEILTADGDRVSVMWEKSVPIDVVMTTSGSDLSGTRILAIRPENILLWPVDKQPPQNVNVFGRGHVKSDRFLGASNMQIVRVNDIDITSLVTSPSIACSVGEEVAVGWSPKAARFVD